MRKEAEGCGCTNREKRRRGADELVLERLKKMARRRWKKAAATGAGADEAAAQRRWGSGE